MSNGTHVALGRCLSVEAVSAAVPRIKIAKRTQIHPKGGLRVDPRKKTNQQIKANCFKRIKGTRCGKANSNPIPGIEANSGTRAAPHPAGTKSSAARREVF
jgi:hypothetical protein